MNRKNVINYIFKTIIILFVFVFLLNNLSVFAADSIDVDSKAALMIELNTGKVIYEKNAKEKLYPASVTKILTAILVIENCKLDDVAIASENAITSIPDGYVIAPLYIGEQMTIEDLLYALMLKSSNDAACVLAEHVGGSIDGFSKMMNEKAKELGCENTNFVNPNGIHNDNHYTTAYDLYLISKYAMQNETFVKIVSTYKYTLSATNKYSKRDRVMQNTNNYVNPNSKYYNASVKGIKTGTTLQAGNCLITNIEMDGFNYIIVVLGADTSDGKFSETQKMMEYAFENYTFTPLHSKGDVIKTIEVEKATQETKNLNLVISDNITVMNNIKINVKEIEPEISLNENIVAPINKGQELGTVKFDVDGLEYNAKLLAENDVELKTYYVEIAICVGVILVIILLIVIIKKKRRRKNKIRK